MSVRHRLSLAAGVGAGLVLLNESVHAHAFGMRYDLPIPLWLYLVGAGAAVAVSFLVVALLARREPIYGGYPRLDLGRVGIGRLLGHRAVVLAVKLFAALVFVLVVVAGYFGNESPLKNFAPTVVWILWWVGFAFACALFGNLWALVNPWAIFYDAAVAFRRAIRPGAAVPAHRPYPERLGVWPAVILFLGFAWMELVWSGGEKPFNIALSVTIYSVITWVGMWWFGKHAWLRGGEAFSVVFALIARFAPTEVRVTDTTVCAACGSADCMSPAADCIDCLDCHERAADAQRTWGLRPYAVGLLRDRPVHGSLMVFVLLMLSTVSFDGIKETPFWQNMFDALFESETAQPVLYGLYQLTGDAAASVETIALAVAPLVFMAVYLLFCWLMIVVVRLGGGQTDGVTVLRLGGLFVLSLMPIALAYHLSHYLSFLMIPGQLIIPLISDPLGYGWDLFGTAAYRIDIGVINTRAIWYTAVAAIVIGHMIAVYVAHVVSLWTFDDRRSALLSQVPMLVLMVGYTMVSLWILSQPIVE